MALDSEALEDVASRVSPPGAAQASELRRRQTCCTLPLVMRPQPMIVVRDVEASSKWFQQVLGLRSGHGGGEYEMLMDGDDLVMQLHRWEAHEHPHLGDESDPSRGNGVLLWFATDDFAAAVARVDAANATVLDGPLYNPNARQQEIWLRGPDGYRIVVAGPRNLG